MRLTEKEIKAICEAFREHFAPGDKLYLFGSRVDDSKRGGDIDLFIQTHETDYDITFQNKIRFTVDLKIRIGDQKIDVVIQSPGRNLPIYDEALKTGIVLYE
ncbi:MAG: nucleotidyltransferase domain-containing protein [Alphaproteobacteria bacterium]|nr:nucleotidyltransferase domain-containing protein [Alphaproteobacteria bacterium]